MKLKEFRDITKDLCGETVINTTIEFGNPISIRGTINRVHIVPKEFSYGTEGYITLTQKKPNSETSEEVEIYEWIGKNKPKLRNTK